MSKYRKKLPSHIVYNAGCGIYEIAFYNSKIEWHNGPMVTYCYSYSEAIQVLKGWKQ